MKYIVIIQIISFSGIFKYAFLILLRKTKENRKHYKILITKNEKTNYIIQAMRLIRISLLLAYVTGSS